MKNNLIAYFIFILVASTGLLYGNKIRGDFPFLRVWDYQNILILLSGIPFLFLQSRANIPDFLDKGISNKHRFLIPALTGAIFGILDILVIKVIQHPEPYTEMPPFLQPFPYSLFLYTSGALEIEVFYRFIPLTLIMLFAKWYKNGNYFNTIFWIGAVLTSFREPLEQLPDGEALFITYSLLTGFLMNFLQAIHFKKSGFLASISLRLGHYLFWHILLGVYVQYFELL